MIGAEISLAEFVEDVRRFSGELPGKIKRNRLRPMLLQDFVESLGDASAIACPAKPAMNGSFRVARVIAYRSRVLDINRLRDRRLNPSGTKPAEDWRDDWDRREPW